MMLEIRIHGRGGQGAVVASKALAQAFFLEGRYVQAFPDFGTERRGAPVRAFVRTDEKPILVRSNVYEPDHVMVLDPSLIKAVDVVSGLKKGGWILINSDIKPAAYKFPGYRTATVDATKIALKHRLGSPTSPIVNTAILGAFARITNLVRIDSVANGIKEFVPVKKEENAAAAEEAYEAVIYNGRHPPTALIRKKKWTKIKK